MHEATLEKEGFLEKLILYSGDWELVVIIQNIALSAIFTSRLFSRHTKKYPRCTQAVKLSEAVWIFLHSVLYVI